LLPEAYVVPAGMYGCQVWSSGILREGDVLRPTIQTLHLNFSKGTLGVKQSVPNWAVLRDSRLTRLYVTRSVRTNLCNSISLELPLGFVTARYKPGVVVLKQCHS